jgi:acyl-CoA thioesterase FadM
MPDYRYDLSVDVHDVDYNGVAKTSALMQYIQSAAQSQLTSIGLSYDELKERHRAFILSKIKMEFTEPIRAYDRLTAISFPCESRGFSFLRCYGLERDGVTVGRAASIWALVDTESRALVPVNQFELGLDLIEPIDMSLDRIVMPKSETEVGSYTVNYADTDQNRHMNNTHYPDMYANFLPLDGLRIRSMSIQYMNEAPMGERLTVHRALEDGIYYFKTVRSDGKVNTLATVELERI